MFRLSPHEVPARNPSPERLGDGAAAGQGPVARAGGASFDVVPSFTCPCRSRAARTATTKAIQNHRMAPRRSVVRFDSWLIDVPPLAPGGRITIAGRAADRGFGLRQGGRVADRVDMRRLALILALL